MKQNADDCLYDQNYPYPLQEIECYCPKCQRYRERRGLVMLAIVGIVMAVSYWRC